MRKLPKTFSKDEVRRLISVIDKPWLMIAILLALFCGLRRREVAQLEIKNIDLSSKRLRIDDSKSPNRSKYGYGKDRVVPIPQCLVQPLKTYLTLLGNSTEYVFPSVRKADAHIKPEHLWKEYKKVLQEAGLDQTAKVDSRGLKRRQFNFHTLRHTYATILWEKTGDILTVKHALGHSKLETTMVYTHVTNKVVEDKVQNAFQQNTQMNINRNDPLGILMQRLALGEINMHQFKQLKSELIGRPKSYIG